MPRTLPWLGRKQMPWRARQETSAIKYLCYCFQRVHSLLGLVINNIHTAQSLGATSQSNSSLRNIHDDSQKTPLSLTHSLDPHFPKFMLMNDSGVTGDEAEIMLNLESEGLISRWDMTGCALQMSLLSPSVPWSHHL